MEINVNYQPRTFIFEDWQTWECQHDETTIESREVTYFYGETDASFTIEIEVCDECGKDLE